MPRRQTPEPMAAVVGARIRALRQERGMSLSQLGAASHISKGSLSGIERGLALITILTLHNIASGLGSSPAHLLLLPGESMLGTLLDDLRRLPKEKQDELIEKFVRCVLMSDAMPADLLGDDEGGEPPTCP